MTAVYWSVKTGLEIGTLSSFTQTFDIEAISQGLPHFILASQNILVNGETASAEPSTILQLGSPEAKLQYNGGFWRITFILNDENRAVRTVHRLKINDTVVAGSALNRGVGTIEYILDPAVAATWANPLLPGQTCVIAWEEFVLDDSVDYNVRASVNSFIALYVEDLGSSEIVNLNVISDSFNRPNGSVGSTDGGNVASQAWVPRDSSVWNVSGNKLVTTTAGLDNILTVEAAADVKVTVEVDTLSASGISGVIVRWADDSNYIGLTVSETGSLDLYKVVGGSNTGISIGAATVSAGSAISLEASGSSLKVYVDGIEVDEASDSFNDTEINIGVIGSNNDIALDNFIAVW